MRGRRQEITRGVVRRLTRATKRPPFSEQIAGRPGWWTTDSRRPTQGPPRFGGEKPIKHASASRSIFVPLLITSEFMRSLRSNNTRHFQIVDATGSTFLVDVDKRFPRLTQPRWPGKSVDADSSERFGPFSLAIPTTVEKTNCILNACLVQWTYDARGGYHKFLNHVGVNIIGSPARARLYFAPVWPNVSPN
jgi:hypothetical protein